CHLSLQQIQAMWQVAQWFKTLLKQATYPCLHYQHTAKHQLIWIPFFWEIMLHHTVIRPKCFKGKYCL
ncbi:hypothetical protein, partial [Klebsiella pneumoniae]|uniref:hypothetical protein n=1 Tax=Klebsiella pneumoniae TaxID=573 RepID=UPI0019D6FBD0